MPELNSVQKKMRKISLRSSRSPEYAEFSHFTLLFCGEQQRNVQLKIHNVRAELFFFSLNLLFSNVAVAVAAVVLVCLRSILSKKTEQDQKIERSRPFAFIFSQYKSHRKRLTTMTFAGGRRSIFVDISPHQVFGLSSGLKWAKFRTTLAEPKRYIVQMIETIIFARYCLSPY